MKTYRAMLMVVIVIIILFYIVGGMLLIALSSAVWSAVLGGLLIFAGIVATRVVWDMRR